MFNKKRFLSCFTDVRLAESDEWSRLIHAFVSFDRNASEDNAERFARSVLAFNSFVKQSSSGFIFGFVSEDEFTDLAFEVYDTVNSFAADACSDSYTRASVNF